MKIHELSELTGINPETIRSYRLRGLLNPVQLPNGYYDYSMEDFANLAHLRKLRYCNFSLKDIEDSYNSKDMVQEHIFERESHNLQTQIRDLQDKLRMVEFERKYLRDSRKNQKKAQQMVFQDTRYDYYTFMDSTTKIAPEVIRRICEIGTISVRISKEALNGACTDRTVPLQTGIGSYLRILKKEKLPVLENSVCTPKGIYITQVIQLADLSSINLLQLAPMMTLAKEIGKEFISDTTGYLMYVRNISQKTEYHFRIRACIEKNA